MPKEFLQALAVKSEMELDAPSTIAANFGLVDGSAHLFLANFGGLVPGKVANSNSRSWSKSPYSGRPGKFARLSSISWPDPNSPRNKTRRHDAV